jgi:hypothetical protein
MNASASLDDFAKRPLSNWTQDGLLDLMIGVVMVGPLVTFLIGEALPKDSSWSRVYPFVTPWLWLGWILALARVFRRLKERIIFPRTGYVAFPDPNWRRRAVLLILANGLAFLWLHWSRVSGLAVALVMAATLLIEISQLRLPHVPWPAIVALLLGVGTYQMGTYHIETRMLGALWLMVVMGFTRTLTGAWKLRSFLKANPRPEEPAA